MSVSLNLSSRLEAFSIKIAASLSWVSCSVRFSPEKALETISKRLLDQIKDGETPSKELGELAKVMKYWFQHIPILLLHQQPFIVEPL